MQATEKRKAGQQRQPATENTFFKLQAQRLEEFVALHPSEWRVRDTRLSCPPREVRGMILGARKQSPVLVLTKERFLQIVGERNRDMLWSEVFADLDSDFNGQRGGMTGLAPRGTEWTCRGFHADFVVETVLDFKMLLRNISESSCFDLDDGSEGNGCSLLMVQQCTVLYSALLRSHRPRRVSYVLNEYEYHSEVTPASPASPAHLQPAPFARS